MLSKGVIYIIGEEKY